MGYFADITWTQLILITIGSLLQFFALCTFVRERRAYVERNLPKEKVVNTQAQEQKLAEQEILLRTIHAGPAPQRPREEHETAFRAADLLKTAKVKFKQNFRFREHGHI